MAKSVITAYILWLVGGLFGLHHVYLERDKQAFISFSTLGGFLIGLLNDLYRMPDYVREANQDVEFMKQFDKIKSQLKVPAFFTSKTLKCVCVGSFFSYVTAYSISPESDHIFIYYSMQLVVPFVVAFVVYLAGTEGPVECEFKWPLLGSCIGHLTYNLLDFEKFYLYSAVLTTLFLEWNIKWDANYYKNKKNIKKSMFKRALALSVLSCLYVILLSLFVWNNASLTSVNGERVPLKESVKEYFQSEKFSKLYDGLNVLWNFYKAHGITKLYYHLFYDGDALKISNAYNVSC